MRQRDALWMSSCAGGQNDAGDVATIVRVGILVRRLSVSRHPLPVDNKRTGATGWRGGIYQYGADRKFRGYRKHAWRDRDDADSHQAERQNQMQDRIGDKHSYGIAALQSSLTCMVGDIVEDRRQPAVADERLWRARYAYRECRRMVSRLSENGRYNIQPSTPD